MSSGREAAICFKAATRRFLLKRMNTPKICPAIFISTPSGQKWCRHRNKLKDVFGSALLGSQAFIDCIKNEFISKQKSDRNVPALKQLANQATIPGICQTVESVLGETPRLSRKVKIFLCRKHTTASLAVIGDRFGIGDSAVAQSYSRFLNEIKTDRRLRRQADKIEKWIKM